MVKPQRWESILNGELKLTVIFVESEKLKIKLKASSFLSVSGMSALPVQYWTSADEETLASTQTVREQEALLFWLVRCCRLTSIDFFLFTKRYRIDVFLSADFLLTAATKDDHQIGYQNDGAVTQISNTAESCRGYFFMLQTQETQKQIEKIDAFNVWHWCWSLTLFCWSRGAHCWCPQVLPLSHSSAAQRKAVTWEPAVIRKHLQGHTTHNNTTS